MATTSGEPYDRLKLYKFTKILTLKVAQIVVQSRQGKKITQDINNIKALEHIPSTTASNIQWVSREISIIEFYL